jgi:hypothetical protein
MLNRILYNSPSLEQDTHSLCVLNRKRSRKAYRRGAGEPLPDLITAQVSYPRRPDDLYCY